ncbi:carbohydrate ABC transporter permease [Micromonosporaceae bacterium B7E4]
MTVDSRTLQPEAADPERAAERLGRPRRRRGIQTTRGYRVFQVINAIVLTGVVVVTLYPFLNIVARSLSDEAYIIAGQVSVVPRGFNVDTYKLVMSDSLFWTNYRNTVVYTVVATAIAMVLTTCFAYVLSKHHLKGRTVLIGIAVFTMFFNGGLIPNYVLISSLGMTNTIWAIVLPNAISVFNLLVMKAFFESLPVELEEAAAVDGLNTYGILLRIVLPLSKAVIATMILFYAVSFWNSWFSAFLYMDRQDLLPVTVYLRNLIAGAVGAENVGAINEANEVQAEATLKAVTIVLTTLPILLVYPFVQRYFVSGVMLGAVKG